MVKTGIPVPATIPDESRGFSLCVPDSPEMMGIVMGAIKILTFGYYWQGSEEQVEAVTTRFKRMYFEYQEQVGCMDCEQVADCIEADEATQEAIAAAIRSSLAIQQALNDNFDPTIPGTTIPPSYANQNMMDPATEDCDNDLAWGHIRNAVDRWFQRVEDVLEQIELTTDNQEMLTAALDVIPVLGTGLRAAGVGSLIGWFDNVRAFLKDAWEAGDTVDRRDEIACALFCIWQQDCTLSFDQIRQYFWTRAQDNFPTYENAFTDIAALLLAMGNPTELTGTFVVDCLLATEFGFTSFINDWFGVRVEKMANDMLLGEASDDWMALCPDCPTEYCHRYDATHDLNTFFTPAGFLGAQAVWSGTGWAINPAVAVGRITLAATFGATTNITHVVIELSEPTIDGNIQQIVLFSPTFATAIGNAPSTATGIDIDVADGDYGNLLIDVEADSDTTIDPIPGEITAITFYGSGAWASTGGDTC